METPSRRRKRAKKFWKTILPALVVIVVGVSVGIVLVARRLTHPPPVTEAVNPQHYLLKAAEASWVSRDGRELSGFWIAGRRGAPAIILAPGYGMSRSDGLSLAALLHRAGFHVLLYAQRGCGSEPRGPSWLGFREADDMRAALDLVRGRAEVDRSRIGIWGVDIGARSALVAAAGRPEVRAIAADSAYMDVADFAVARLREDFGIDSGFADGVARGLLRMIKPLVASREASDPRPDALAGRPVLFISGQNRPAMANLTAELHDRMRRPGVLLTLPAARVRLMAGEELSNYDLQVAGFFQLHLTGKNSAKAPETQR